MNYNKMLAGLRDLVDNPTPRVPVALCLDISGSMAGQAITELNAGLAQFLQELQEDPLTSCAAEMAVVTFGSGATCVADFQTVAQVQVPPLSAGGATYMGEGLNLALELLETRKKQYKKTGVDYYQPILVVMSDGCPNGDPRVYQQARQRIQELTQKRCLTVVAVGMGNEADMEELQRIGNRKAVKLHGLQFREFFAWLSQSVCAVSASTPEEQPQLDLQTLQVLAAQPWPENSL